MWGSEIAAYLTFPKHLPDKLEKQVFCTAQAKNDAILCYYEKELAAATQVKVNLFPKG